MIGLGFGPIIDMCLVTIVKKTKLVQSQVLRRALSDEHQALLCLKLCSDMEEVRDDIHQHTTTKELLLYNSQSSAPVSSSCEIVKITKSCLGRSANVRTPLGPVHGFSLRDVQLHKVSGPRSPGDSQ